MYKQSGTVYAAAFFVQAAAFFSRKKTSRRRLRQTGRQMRNGIALLHLLEIIPPDLFSYTRHVCMEIWFPHIQHACRRNCSRKCWGIKEETCKLKICIKSFHNYNTTTTFSKWITRLVCSFLLLLFLLSHVATIFLTPSRAIKLCSTAHFQERNPWLRLKK